MSISLLNEYVILCYAHETRRKLQSEALPRFPLFCIKFAVGNLVERLADNAPPNFCETSANAEEET